MIVTDIKKYITGSLKIKVEGLNLEKFLNMSVAHGISFWDVKRLSMTVIELKISIKGYRMLKKVLKKTGCQVSIIDKEGLPFFIFKLKKRKMLAIGFVVFILLIFVLSSFVWSVKVTGARTTSIRDIETNLAELGVRPGAFKLDVAVADVENNMLIKMASLSWIKVKLVGTRAEVEVKERVVPPEIVPETEPCNVVAKRDGVILKVVSSKGDVVVKEGDPVRQGDILVTGILKRENMEDRYIHAESNALARTWYESTAAILLKRLEKVRTGKVITNVSITLGSRKIAIKNSPIPYTSYDKIVKSTKLIDTDIFQLPFEIVLDEYHETTAKSIVLSKEEAKAEAADKAEKNIIDNLPSDAKILNKNIQLEFKDSMVIAKALIETIEDIGMQVEIKNSGILQP